MNVRHQQLIPLMFGDITHLFCSCVLLMFSSHETSATVLPLCHADCSRCMHMFRMTLALNI
jgi:hypothetical protein